MRQQRTKWDLVNPIVNIYSPGFYRNLFRIFLSFISFSMHFRILNEFLEFLTQKKNWKRRNSTGPVLAIGHGPLAWPSCQHSPWCWWSSSVTTGSCDNEGARGVRERLPTEGRVSTGGAHCGERKTTAVTSVPTPPMGVDGVVRAPWRGEREAWGKKSMKGGTGGLLRWGGIGQKQLGRGVRGCPRVGSGRGPGPTGTSKIDGIWPNASVCT
jgi:hypothetical protein